MQESRSFGSLRSYLGLRAAVVGPALLGADAGPRVRTAHGACPAWAVVRGHPGPRPPSGEWRVSVTSAIFSALSSLGII